jgi:hypothetical protein
MPNPDKPEITNYKHQYYLFPVKKKCLISRNKGETYGIFVRFSTQLLGLRDIRNSHHYRRGVRGGCYPYPGASGQDRDCPQAPGSRGGEPHGLGWLSWCRTMDPGLTAIAGFLAWLVFFKFKWIKLTYAWGLFFLFFAMHLMLIFLIGLRYVAPYTTNATVIQHTIQLVPRLPEPTLVTAVLVEPGVPVKRGQPLFQFDRRPYEYKVRQIEAQLAQANQNVQVMKADTEAAAQKVAKLKSELVFAKYAQKLSAGLARQGAGRE